MRSFQWLQAILLVSIASVRGYAIPTGESRDLLRRQPKVLILGGGVAGIIAARSLQEQGIYDFVIVEARDELGGRMKTHTFAGKTVEAGANWVQGTQTGSGPANPIFTLAKKHKLRTQVSNFSGNLTTFDATGLFDFRDIFDKSVEDYVSLTTSAGARVSRSLVDVTAKTGYALIGANSQSHHAQAAEYYNFDWEFAQKPDQTSWIASSWASNFTFDPEHGGFSEENLFSIDQRGFKTIILGEADEFLKPQQISLNSTVTDIKYSDSGVTVKLRDGKSISGDYALCTFSVGVLQNDDVKFQPKLPDWKQEAIQTMTMGTYTKIFLRFPKKFWFDTEVALYADTERGRYPVWQSLDHEGFFPGSGIIFVTVTGDYSKRIEALSDAQVRDEAVGVLKLMYPDVDIPAPLDFYFPRWNADPLSRGSFSNWPPSFSSEHHDNIRANIGRLYFAGEGTSQKYFGYLHGAYFEGQDVAKMLVKCIKGGGCADLQHTKEVTNAHPYKI